MKRIINKWFFIGAAALLFSACKKQETKLYYQDGTAPVLSSSVQDTIQLNPADSLNQAVLFSWTNPNYSFSNGISPYSVNYNLEIDTSGANFAGPNKQTVVIASDLSQAYTVKDLNALLANGLVLTYGANHNIQVRITSTVANGGAGALKQISNVLNFVVKPYAPPPKISPLPLNGDLYIVGDATPGGWPPLSVDPSTQKFTQVSATEYTLTIALTGGKEYKLVSIPGQWTYQWSVKDTDTFPSGGPFVYNGSNSIAPSSSGTYTIDVNFQTGTFTVTQ